MGQILKNIIRQVGVKDCKDCPTSYRFINGADKIYHTQLTGYEYTHEEFEVDNTNYRRKVKKIQVFKDGKVIVFQGAGSDGCSPVWLFMNRFYWSTPNGRKVQTASGLLEPITARSFYIHDWLLKISEPAGIPKSAAHNVFCAEIKKTDFWLRHVYCRLVRRFGPKD